MASLAAAIPLQSRLSAAASRMAAQTHVRLRISPRKAQVKHGS